MWKTAVLVLLLAAGCVEGPCEEKYGTCPSDLPEDQRDDWRGANLQSTLVLDPNLSQAELDAVLAAADAWESATRGKVRVACVVGDGELPAHNVVRCAHTDELKTAELASTGTTIMLLGSGLGANPHLRAVVMHEFGHYLGLGHEPDLLDDIMYPYTHDGMPESPTPDALSDLRDLYDW